MLNRRLALGLALLTAGVVHAGEVTDAPDRYTGAREIAYTGETPPGRDSLLLPIFTVKGEVTDQGELFLVQLIFAPDLRQAGASKYRYASCHTVDWLVDGKPLKLAAATHRFMPAGRDRFEAIGQRITGEQIRVIGAGSVVEYRVCSDEYRLAPADIAAFRTIGAKLEGVPAR